MSEQVKSQQQNPRKILVCGNPDLNYIDGSSIWAQTIALVFAEIPGTQVDFIAKSTPKRFELYSELQNHSSINIIDGTQPEYWQGSKPQRLTMPMMGDLTIKLHKENQYDHIIIRGFDIATHLIRDLNVLARCWMYLTDIPQKVEELSSDQKLIMSTIASHCAALLCQTQGFAELWEKATPKLDSSKVFIYSPVIPDFEDNLITIEQRSQIAVYAGKFKGDWNTLEMSTSWPKVSRDVPAANLLMIGDKVHQEPTIPDYEQKMRQALEHTEGLQWLGALPRQEVQNHLKKAKVGLSWRAESMNDTVEYSTKILEYGGAGCAAILNRNSLHESLLGADYPLYANSEEEFKEKLKIALTDNAKTQIAADKLITLAKAHTFSQRVQDIGDWLTKVESKNSTRASYEKTKVLVAGHDLKFFTLLQNKLEKTGLFEFKIDQWQGHNKHSEKQSRKLLEWADVIFCEWCLGNIKWYSHNKHAHHRLVARFHAQENRANFMNEVKWESIDHISFVSNHTRDEAKENFPELPLEKTSIIHNLLDEDKFKPLKKTGEAAYTLGIVGVTPKSKRLDRAIDLLEALLQHDERFILRVKGKNPLDYPWIHSRPDEISYYQEIFERINSSKLLRHKVIFDPPGDDVNEWFRMVGYILSPSDFESFHMAVGEGILTGARPIIWNWKGASEIWGDRDIVKNKQEAMTKILSKSRAISNLPRRLKSDEVVFNWKDRLIQMD
tara:strand:- start:2289 stop:4463 length:2175 start_codon:yes stop_codon:yes gene_type:complete